MKKYLWLLLIVIAVLSGCKHSGEDSDADISPNAKTPVTLTKVSVEPISESFELRASSVFQKKVAVKASAIGYIDNVKINIGDEVTVGQLLFSIKTKEAAALENVNVLKDTSLHFVGVINIYAQKSGTITTLDHQKGDYVQDGDQLGIISERNSFVFVLEVPFELHSYMKMNGSCDIVLPDNQMVQGVITNSFPTMDPVAQTQTFIIKPVVDQKLPENLIAKVRIVKNTKDKATVLPKLALLADETQTMFWVMKLINDSVAIKIPVTKGIETNEKVEITAPQFNALDRIVLTGNYGLGDTAKVTVIKN